DQVGGLVGHRADQEDQPLTQKAAVDVVGALAASRCLDDDRRHAQTNGFQRAHESFLLYWMIDMSGLIMGRQGRAGAVAPCPFGQTQLSPPSARRTARL